MTTTDRDDEEFLSMEGPDIETPTGASVQDPATDPLDSTPIPDPDLEAPAQEDEPS